MVKAERIKVMMMRFGLPKKMLTKQKNRESGATVHGVTVGNEILQKCMYTGGLETEGGKHEETRKPVEQNNYPWFAPRVIMHLVNAI